MGKGTDIMPDMQGQESGRSMNQRSKPIIKTYLPAHSAAPDQIEMMENKIQSIKQQSATVDKKLDHLFTLMSGIKNRVHSNQ